jgi:DNA-binding transcriptional ArsR family regulator
MLPVEDARATGSSRASQFAALGDATRLELVVRLSAGSALSIAQLSAGLPLTRQAITKHLRVLESAGIVCCVHTGRESRFALDPAAVLKLLNYLEAVARHWDGTLLRFKSCMVP